jgi:hypothetical protein
MTSSPFTIGRATAGEIIDIRHRMLRQGMPRSEAMFNLDDDAQTIHAAARVNGQVIGCATYIVRRWKKCLPASFGAWQW